MAGFDADPLPLRPAPHDGPARCRMCATCDAGAGHDWCPAAGSLVCDDCCRRILLGAVGAHISAALGSGPVPEESACASCERGARWFESHILGAISAAERRN